MPKAKKKVAPRASRSGTGTSSMRGVSQRRPNPELAVYAGSFDPITTGHVDIIRRACNTFPQIRVAVAYNPNKEKAMFSPEERIQMVNDSLPELKGRMQADSFTGLLIDYARQAGAGVLIRGLRAVSDFEYEFQMTMMNRHLCPDLETVFLMAGEQHFYTSSRLVKEVASFGGDVSSFVPAQVLERFNRKLEPLAKKQQSSCCLGGNGRSVGLGQAGGGGRGKGRGLFAHLLVEDGLRLRRGGFGAIRRLRGSGGGRFGSRGGLLAPLGKEFGGTRSAFCTSHGQRGPQDRYRPNSPSTFLLHAILT